MTHRRLVLSAATLGGVGLLIPKIVNSAESTPISIDSLSKFGFVGPEDDPQFGPIITGKGPTGITVGPGLSRHEEVRRAFRFLLDAPRRKGQLATAQYFEALAKYKNSDGETYNSEWKVRSNPLIVGFFSLTNTTPAAGDQTSWCAAFVSFCLYCANKENKFSALSGGYRSYSAAIRAPEKPKAGDLAVYSEYGQKGAQGFGHVGFVLREETQKGVPGVVLLSGNARGTTGTTGAVTSAWFPNQGKDIELHSFRRVPNTMLPES